MKNIADFPTQETRAPYSMSLNEQSAGLLFEALSQIAAKGPQAAILADLYAQAKSAVDSFAPRSK